MIILCDIDGTICSNTNGLYNEAVPFPERIAKINELFKEHVIIYWTARGTVTGKNWEKLTKSQLYRWGAKYHYLKFNKPQYDLFICDKSVNVEEYFK